MLTALFCSNCGIQLTRPLILRSGKDPSVRAPKYEGGRDLVDQGEVFKSYEPIQRSYGEQPAPLEFTPQFWVNRADLTEAVRLTKKRGRLNGCCGLDGVDGPNQLCSCGAEIGTLKTDCWTAHVFIPEPTGTRWERLPEE
jgi:hypothetical protein